MFLRLLLILALIVSWTCPVSALGLSGGIEVQQTGDYPPGSPIFNANKVQDIEWSTVDPTANQLFWYNATQTKMIPITIVPGTNVTFSITDNTLTINSAGSGFGANATTGTIDFDALMPTETNGGTVDTTRHTVYLSPTSTTGVLFGSKILPGDWDGTSDLVLQALLATPDLAGASSTVFQLKYQILKAGAALYSTAGFTTVGTFTAALASQVTAQTYTNASFKLAAGSIAAGDRIHLRIDRIGANAGDTHGDNLHVVAIKGTYTR